MTVLGYLSSFLNSDLKTGKKKPNEKLNKTKQKQNQSINTTTTTTTTTDNNKNDDNNNNNNNNNNHQKERKKEKLITLKAKKTKCSNDSYLPFCYRLPCIALTH